MAYRLVKTRELTEPEKLKRAITALRFLKSKYSLMSDQAVEEYLNQALQEICFKYRPHRSLKGSLDKLKPVGKVSLPPLYATSARIPGAAPGFTRLAPLWSGDPPGSLSGVYYHSVSCPRCATQITDTQPFTKRPCPSCAKERIQILLNSQ